MSQGRSGRATGTVDVGSGIASFFGGISFVLTTPSVWGYAAAPVVIALLLTCGLGGLGFTAARQLALRIIDEQANNAAVQSWAVTILLGLIFLALSVLLALVLAQPLSGWALEAISRRQQRALTGREPADLGTLTSLAIGLRCSVFILLAGGLSTLILLTITMVFPPAVVVTVPLKFLLVAWFLAWDLIDYPLGLRGMGIRKRLRWALGHFGAFTAFGLIWAGVLLIPGIFLLILPLGVAGATRLVVASEEDTAPHEDVLDADVLDAEDPDEDDLTTSPRRRISRRHPPSR